MRRSGAGRVWAAPYAARLARPDEVQPINHDSVFDLRAAPKADVPPADGPPIANHSAPHPNPSARQSPVTLSSPLPPAENPLQQSLPTARDSQRLANLPQPDANSVNTFPPTGQAPGGSDDEARPSYSLEETRLRLDNILANTGRGKSFLREVHKEVLEVGVQAYEEQASTFLENLLVWEGEDRPSLRNAIGTIQGRWEAYIATRILSSGEQVEEQDMSSFIYSPSTVLKYAAAFIRDMGRFGTGRDNEKIRTSTLVKATQIFVQMIVRFVFDEDGAPCGAKLLLRIVTDEKNRGSSSRRFLRKTFLALLFDTVKLVSEEECLNTEKCPTGWLTISETRLALDQLWADAIQEPKRLDSHLQTILSIQLAFTCGARAGSQVASYAEWKDKWEKSLCHRDIELRREHGMLFAVVVFRNLKGHASILDSSKLVFELSEPFAAQNVVFDFPWTYLLRMWHKGYVKGYETLEDLLNDTADGVIVIDDGHEGNLPLHHRHSHAGTLKPEDHLHGIDTSTLNASLRQALRKVFIEVGGFHCFRRDFGDWINNLRGSHVASFLLGHSDDLSTLDVHYTRGAMAYDVVHDRLQESEIIASVPRAREVLAQTSLAGPAMRARLALLSKQSRDATEGSVPNGHKKKFYSMNREDANAFYASTEQGAAAEQTRRELLHMYNSRIAVVRSEMRRLPKVADKGTPMNRMYEWACGDSEALAHRQRYLEWRQREENVRKIIVKEENKRREKEGLKADLALPKAGKNRQPPPNAGNTPHPNDDKRASQDDHFAAFIGSKAANLITGSVGKSLGEGSAAFIKASKEAGRKAKTADTSSTRAEADQSLVADSVVMEEIQAAQEQTSPGEPVVVRTAIDVADTPSEWDSISANFMRRLFATVLNHKHEWPMTCPDCGNTDTTFQTKYKLQRHYERKHNGKVAPQAWSVGVSVGVCELIQPGKASQPSADDMDVDPADKGLDETSLVSKAAAETPTSAMELDNSSSGSNVEDFSFLSLVEHTGSSSMTADDLGDLSFLNLLDCSKTCPSGESPPPKRRKHA